MPRLICLFLGLITAGFFTESRASTASEFADRTELRQLVMESRFLEIEKILGNLQSRYEKSRSREDEQRVVFAYASFYTTDSELARKLDDWIAASHDSYIPWMARSTYFQHISNVYRGSGFSFYVSDPAWKGHDDFSKQAISDLRQAIMLKPDFSWARALLIAELMEYGFTKAARSNLNDCLNLDPYSYECRYRYLFYLQPKWGGSLEEMRQFIRDTIRHSKNEGQLTPLWAFVDYTKGNILVLENKWQEALEHYNVAIKRDPRWWYFLERGRAARSLGRYEDAAVDFKEALRLRPQTNGILVDLGYTYWEMGRVQEALAYSTEALALDPLNPRTLLLNAYVYWYLGKRAQAMEIFEKAKDQGRFSQGILIQVGYMLMWNGQMKAGREAMWEAFWLQPINPRVWKALFVAYLNSLPRTQFVYYAIPMVAIIIVAFVFFFLGRSIFRMWSRFT